MKLPRDLSGTELAQALGRIEYTITRQTGSHMRLSHPGPPQFQLTIPAHEVLKVGTLAGILAEVAKQRGLAREDLLLQLFA